MPIPHRFDPLSASYLIDPAPVLKQAHEESPVFFYEPLNCWVVTKYEDLKTALSDVALFSSRATGFIRPPADMASKVVDLCVEEIIITLDPPIHSLHRNTMARGFLSPIISRMEGTIRACASDLLDSFADKKQIDLMKHYCVPLTMNSIVKILGVPERHKASYRQWSEDFFFMLTPRVLDAPAAVELRNVPEAELRLRWGRLAEANHFLREYVDHRSRDPGDDIISAMLKVRSPDGSPAISSGAIIRHLISLIGAGHDTTANSIAHLVKNFSDATSQRELVLADATLYPNAVEEGMRMRGSVPGNFRVTTRDTELRGERIPRHSLVYLLIAAGGHDEELFPSSLEFNVRRINANKHLAFGFGRHTCIGNALARLQTRVAVEELFNRFPNVRVKPGFTPQYLPLMTVTGLLSLDVFLH
jgi:cytochrome P450